MKEEYVLDKAELEKRLIKLTQTPYTGKVAIGADCYAPQNFFEYVDYICPVCKKPTTYNSLKFDPRELRKIKEIVNELKKKGYDVLLDQTEYCEFCNGKKMSEPMSIFKIRFDDNDEYHIARSDFYDFKYLQTFLQGRDHFLGSYDNTKALHWEIDRIHKMTGLGDKKDD